MSQTAAGGHETSTVSAYGPDVYSSVEPYIARLLIRLLQLLRHPSAWLDLDIEGAP
jgi:hypothetical protein